MMALRLADESELDARTEVVRSVVEEMKRQGRTEPSNEAKAEEVP
jgi:hypothetical protein